MDGWQGWMECTIVQKEEFPLALRSIRLRSLLRVQNLCSCFLACSCLSRCGHAVGEGVDVLPSLPDAGCVADSTGLKQHYHTIVSLPLLQCFLDAPAPVSRQLQVAKGRFVSTQHLVCCIVCCSSLASVSQSLQMIRTEKRRRRKSRTIGEV